MKKLRVLLGLIFITIVLMSINVNSALVLKDSNKLINAYKNNSLVRLHVIANSNSPRDQYIKRNVRNQLLAYMGKYGDKDKIELNDDLYKIEDFINKTLKKKGIDYGAKVELGVYSFPDRTYQELTLPAGRYKALKVELGQGGGANWWCVLLPPMCIEDQKKINTDSKQIIFRFKILDWFNNREESDIIVESKNCLTTQQEKNYTKKINFDNQYKSLAYNMLIDKSKFYTIVNNKNKNNENQLKAIYNDNTRFIKDKDYKFKNIIKLSLH